jgi:hypothetical protein
MSESKERALAKRLVEVGRWMANACFNLSQPAVTLDDRSRSELAGLARDWDAAAREARAILAEPEQQGVDSTSRPVERREVAYLDFLGRTGRYLPEPAYGPDLEMLAALFQGVQYERERYTLAVMEAEFNEWKRGDHGSPVTISTALRGMIDRVKDAYTVGRATGVWPEPKPEPAVTVEEPTREELVSALETVAADLTTALPQIEGAVPAMVVLCTIRDMAEALLARMHKPKPKPKEGA